MRGTATAQVGPALFPRGAIFEGDVKCAFVPPRHPNASKENQKKNNKEAGSILE